MNIHIKFYIHLYSIRIWHLSETLVRSRLNNLMRLKVSLKLFQRTIKRRLSSKQLTRIALAHVRTVQTAIVESRASMRTTLRNSFR
jgi:hypothetical protein